MTYPYDTEGAFCFEDDLGCICGNQCVPPYYMGTNSMSRWLMINAPHIWEGDPQILRIGGPQYELLYRLNERAKGRGDKLGKPTNWKGL